MISFKMEPIIGAGDMRQHKIRTGKGSAIGTGMGCGIGSGIKYGKQYWLWIGIPFRYKLSQRLSFQI